MAKLSFLNFPAGRIAEVRAPFLKGVVGKLAENPYELLAVSRRKGQKIFGYGTIQDIPVIQRHSGALVFPVLVTPFELLRRYFLTTIHRGHPPAGFLPEFAFGFLLQFVEEHGQLKAVRSRKAGHLFF